MTCKKDENVKDCTCSKKTCENYGVCCACVRKHKAKGELPNCLRTN